MLESTTAPASAPEPVDDVRELRPKRAERPKCGARCRSRLEVVGDVATGLSAIAGSVHFWLCARGGRATLRALAGLGTVEAVRGAVRELVDAGVVRYGTCGAHVLVDRDETGKIRVRSKCRLHGGASTGAKTAEGRARLAEAGRKGAVERWRRWRIIHMSPSPSSEGT